MPVFLFLFFSLCSFLHTCVGCVRKSRLPWVWKPQFGLCIVSKLSPVIPVGLFPPPDFLSVENVLVSSALWWQTLAYILLYLAVQNPPFLAKRIDNGDQHGLQLNYYQ